MNAVECMVGMIAASRQFEQQMRLLQTAETNDKSASRGGREASAAAQLLRSAVAATPVPQEKH